MTDRPVAGYIDPGEVAPSPGIEHLEHAGSTVRGLGTGDAVTIAERAAGATVLLSGYTPVSADLLSRPPQLRGLPLFGEQGRDGGWDATAVPAHRFSEVSVGVFGMGRIGRSVVQLLRPVVETVSAYDLAAPQEAWPEGVDRVTELGVLLELSQILTLHAPLTDETRNLTGEPGRPLEPVVPR